MGVHGFADEEEVVARAGATERGLAAGVFTQDSTRAHRVVARLDPGTCWTNQYDVMVVEMLFGGITSSGMGRENGRATIAHHAGIKSVHVVTAPIDCPYSCR